MWAVNPPITVRPLINWGLLWELTLLPQVHGEWFSHVWETIRLWRRRSAAKTEERHSRSFPDALQHRSVMHFCKSVSLSFHHSMILVPNSLSLSVFRSCAAHLCRFICSIHGDGQCEDGLMWPWSCRWSETRRRDTRTHTDRERVS